MCSKYARRSDTSSEIGFSFVPDPGGSPVQTCKGKVISLPKTMLLGDCPVLVWMSDQ
ncbi:hypothetical protein DPMN_178274 [Dreissena polymorpha]|uniref:Uncharacterized protein n=1 Tax=Dreissena polymorpha TaxID=45954 RepID=A0A9D4IJQ5_DREPO|nr:hypothetical protein DPMN_178274 [Dreissena polymorpha]